MMLILHFKQTQFFVVFDLTFLIVSLVKKKKCKEKQSFLEKLFSLFVSVEQQLLVWFLLLLSSFEDDYKKKRSLPPFSLLILA